MSEQANEHAKTTRTLVGRVVSNKMQKTINVLIERKVPHPKYGKYITRRSKIFAHDENNTCQIGDLVMIKECRRLSKNKSWMLVNVLEKAAQKTEVNL
jgi:small subunit ribosomal protein S17